MQLLTENRKVGIFLTAFGSFFLFLGILLLGDKPLLALGNLLFILGIIILIGLENTKNFFFRRQKARGTACFLGGIAIVLVGWPLLGMIVEVFGIFNLFGNFFPVIINVMRQLPFIGAVLRISFINNILNRILGTTLPTTQDDL